MIVSEGKNKNNTDGKTSKYIFNADLVRVLAIFGVVGIHLLSPISSRPDFFGGTFWWLTYLASVLFRASVPLFMMLSGYLILAKDLTVKQTLSRVVNRILIPLIAFYFIYHGYTFVASVLREDPYYFADLVVNLAKNTYSYLYFLVVLVFLYLLSPMFRLIFVSKDKLLPGFIIGLFFLNAILLTFIRYLLFREGEVLNAFTLWLVWIGYFLFGYWFRKNNPKISRKKLVGVFLVGFVFTTGFGYLNLSWNYSGNDLFYIGGQTYAEEYLSVGVIAMSLPLFMLLMNFDVLKFFEKLGWHSLVKKTVRHLSVISFGMYLIHPMVMDFFHKFAGVTADSPSMPNLPAYLLVSSFLTFGVSILLVEAVIRMPGLKRAVGVYTT